jgi:hypothetical protein
MTPKRGIVLIREANAGNWVQKIIEFDPNVGVIRLWNPSPDTSKCPPNATAKIQNKKSFRIKPSPYMIPQYPDALALHLYPVFIEGVDEEDDVGSELHISSMERKDIIEWSYYLTNWASETPTEESTSSSNLPSNPIVSDITEEENRIATAILLKSPASDDVLIDKFNVRVTRKTLQCLRKLEWLSDEVLNFYLSLIQEKFSPKIFFWNSFFYTKLTNGGYNYTGVRNWASRRGIDLFGGKVDMMLLPLHISDQAHWALGVVNMKNFQTIYLDSLGGENLEFHSVILQYLQDEHRKQCGVDLPNLESWSRGNPPSTLPLQTNGSDCGVFICMYALALARGIDPTTACISASMVDSMRKRIVIEIVRGRIL